MVIDEYIVYYRPSSLYISDLINQQIPVVREERENQRLEKDTFAFLLLESRAYPTSLFSELPTSNHATMSKYQVWFI